MAAKRWMQGVKSEMKRKGTEGSFSRSAHHAGMSTSAFAQKHKHSSGLVGKRARLALAFASARRKK
jgi:hypothetical protein